MLSTEDASPLVGFNRNVGYKGLVFHIQTEDSGRKHARIATHIFLGGNILRSLGARYDDILAGGDEREFAETVRKRMEEQHKSGIRALLSGAIDGEIERRSAEKTYDPGVLADGVRGAALLVGGIDETRSIPAQPKESARPPIPIAAGPVGYSRASDPPKGTDDGLEGVDDIIIEYLRRHAVRGDAL